MIFRPPQKVLFRLVSSGDRSTMVPFMHMTATTLLFLHLFSDKGLMNSVGCL